MDNSTANMSASLKNMESVSPETQDSARLESQDCASKKKHVYAELKNPESATPENQESASLKPRESVPPENQDSAPLKNSESLPRKPREYGPLKNLESQLELFIDNTRQIQVMVQDVKVQTQTVLYQKLNGLITGLQEINKHRSQVEDVYVPLEVVCDYIDNNKNPHLYTKDVLLKTLAKNEAVKGTVESFKKFKECLLVELFQTFPDEMNLYRAYRNDTMPREDKPPAQD